MSALLLCTEPSPPSTCLERFRVRASGWIDATNFGGARATRSPEGIRLRWNTPFLSSAKESRVGYPSHFIVKRSKPLELKLFVPLPNAGHEPRSFVPVMFWRDMTRQGNLFSVNLGSDRCEG